MGYMIWHAIKQSAIDIWDEMLYLIVFNVIWLVGTLLIIPWPFVTFALFAIAYDVGQSKGIGFGKFFSYGRQAWKQAYIWGGINLGILIVALVNVSFYSNIAASWAAFLQMLIIGVSIIWFVLQLIALPIYPRLEEPGFKQAVRNAAVLFGRYPLVILTIVGLAAILVAVPLFFGILQILFVLGTFSIIAILMNRMVEAMIKRELKRETEEAETEQN
ncbi:hypothetical protein ACFLXQ_08410 [Chloroflexota bacterium]